MDLTHLASRNETLGFAQRTKKNFLFIEKAFEEGADVHVITQLVTSLLGIVVFPWEQQFQLHAKSARLDELIVAGWPVWTMSGKTCRTLEDLIEVLRHSIAHGNINFSSDDRHLANVRFEFWNEPSDPRRHWQGSISGIDLRTFCMNLLEMVYQSVS